MVEFIKYGVYLPLIDSRCKCIYPIRFGDNITVRTQMTIIHSTYLEFKYEMVNMDNEDKTITKAFSKHALTDLDMNLIFGSNELLDLLKAKSNVQ